MILLSVVVAAFNGQLQEVSTAIFTAAMQAVEISIGLLGPVILWLGLMEMVKTGGLFHRLERLIKPFMGFLFPEVPPHHPASTAIILNLSASFLGMGNAATPLGIKAMQELKRLNANQESASNAMCTLLALNTSSITLFPAFVISLRMAQDAQDPMAIVGCSILATSCSTAGAILASRVLPCFQKGTP